MSDSTKTQGFLTSVSSTVKFTETAKKTPFRNCVVSIDDTLFPAIIWETSFANGVTIGDQYTMEMKPGLDREGKARLFITVLNGAQLTVPTMEHFKHLFADADLAV